MSCNKMNINGLLIFIKFLVFGSINFDNGTAQLSHQTQLLRFGFFLTFYFALRTDIFTVTSWTAHLNIQQVVLVPGSMLRLNLIYL